MHQFEQALGYGEGQGSLACYSPQGHKKSDTTEKQQLRCKSHGQEIKGLNGWKIFWTFNHYTKSCLLNNLLNL